MGSGLKSGIKFCMIHEYWGIYSYVVRIQVGLSLGPVGLGVVMIKVNKLWNKEGKKYFLKASEGAGSG